MPRHVGRFAPPAASGASPRDTVSGSPHRSTRRLNRRGGYPDSRARSPLLHARRRPPSRHGHRLGRAVRPCHPRLWGSVRVAVLWSGSLSEDVAGSWGLPTTAGRRVAVLGLPGSRRGRVRLVEGETPAPPPLATIGWTSLEITVRGIDELCEKVRASGTFRINGEPHDLVFSDQPPAIRAGQAAGPLGDQVYLTEIMRQTPDRELAGRHHLPHGRPAWHRRDAHRARWLSGLRPRPRRAPRRIAARLRPRHLRRTRPRRRPGPRRTSRPPLGAAIRRDEPPYDARRAATLRGGDGELIELVGD